jgi:creatinine amidohydrolase/Fe(II)-dependent formamide hydrolase-like protein
VRTDRIIDDGPEEHPWYDLVPEPARHIPTSGVLANPSDASQEIGERLVGMMLGRLGEAIGKGFGVTLDPDPHNLSLV